MSGWQRQIELPDHPVVYVPPKGVVAIVVAQKFPDPTAIRTTLEDGFGRVAPDTVWIMREAERKGHAVNFAWQTFKAHGITPLLAPLTPAWKSKGTEQTVPTETSGAEGVVERTGIVGAYDMRADWRDSEIRATCERVIVFHDKSSNITQEWINYRDGGSIAKIFVVERGKAKVKKHRQGRKPD